MRCAPTRFRARPRGRRSGFHAAFAFAAGAVAGAVAGAAAVLTGLEVYARRSERESAAPDTAAPADMPAPVCRVRSGVHGVRPVDDTEPWVEPALVEVRAGQWRLTVSDDLAAVSGAVKGYATRGDTGFTAMVAGAYRGHPDLPTGIAHLNVFEARMLAGDDIRYHPERVAGDGVMVLVVAGCEDSWCVPPGSRERVPFLPWLLGECTREGSRLFVHVVVSPARATPADPVGESLPAAVTSRLAGIDLPEGTPTDEIKQWAKVCDPHTRGFMDSRWIPVDVRRRYAVGTATAAMLRIIPAPDTHVPTVDAVIVPRLYGGDSAT